jgi:dTDP-3,4-didehydro-2,6-dideoxy-alpha-D-glucose 3-reductase
MKKIKIGIIGTADIAFRRFLPALKKNSNFEYVGIASREYSKTSKFTKEYGGKGYEGYDALLDDEQIDAVYLPLPPALHYEWAIKALKKGKHVFIEKPFTTNLEDTREILKFAKIKGLSVYENYMFIYHNQLNAINNIINKGVLGQIRLYRIAFGFPKRAENDFRYSKNLGGGALLDCGGYTIKLASLLLGATTKVSYSKLNFASENGIDMFGYAHLENSEGQVAQVSFGMDNSYKCELEIWGSEASLITKRIFTAGPEITPELLITVKDGERKKVISSDDQFLKSINKFYESIQCSTCREEIYQNILKQSSLVERVRNSDV